MSRVVPYQFGPYLPIHGRKSIIASIAAAYVVASIASGLYFLDSVNTSFSNDIWWPHYNLSAYQAFIIDAANDILATRSTGQWDILSSSISKDYSSPTSSTDVNPSYVRQLLFHELTTIEYAVANLRSLSADQSLGVFTQYCWVDFNQRFEMAHTTLRQARCRQRYMANAATYMESVLRNQNWNEFTLAYGGDGGLFTVTIQDAIQATEEGRLWLARTSTAATTLTETEEVAFWKTANLTKFQLPWHNAFLTGIAESIAIENAWGMTQQIYIKQFSRKKASWTSIILFWSLINDLTSLQALNRSAVRMASNSFVQSPAIDLERLASRMEVDGTYVNQRKLFRSVLGPFNSVDAWFVVSPTELNTLVQNITLPRLTEKLLTFYPIPPSWNFSNATYYGGSPLCVASDGRSYVQQTFDLSDNCASPQPLSMEVSLSTATMALIIMNATKNSSWLIPSICASQTTNLCESFLKASLVIAGNMTVNASLVSAARKAVQNLNVSLMQFAVLPNNSWTLLQQPLIARDTVWRFYGWYYLADWAQSRRSVVLFEGDFASLALMSTRSTLQSFLTSTGYLSSATRIVSLVALYTSSVLTFFALLCGIHLVRLKLHDVCEDNILYFNRVVSFVWVGRPLLLVRGIAALIMLSTSQIELVYVVDQGRSRLEFSPRLWPKTVIVAGESLWVAYVVIDFLQLIWSQRLSKYFVTLGSIFAWAVVVAIELLAPVYPVATLNRQCEAIDMDSSIECSSGLVQIGSFGRVITFIAVQVGCLIFAAAVTVIFQKSPQGMAYRSYQHHILGSAEPYFIVHDSDETKSWSLDPVSCVMAGLIPFTFFNRRHFVFDLKLWVIVKNTSVMPTNSICFTKSEPTLPRDTMVTAKRLRKKYMIWLDKLLLLGGTSYMIAAIIGSILYIQVARVNFANDLSWANFNLTVTHVFLGSWLNEQLALGTDKIVFNLDASDLSYLGEIDPNSPSISMPSTFGSHVQHSEFSSLQAAISSLRTTQACSVPWIFTQYCYLDFSKRWELANSALRQKRCIDMASNGALYLEALLRNVVFAEFLACWGDAFNISIANELAQSKEGREWLTQSAFSSRLSITDEIQIWQSYNLSTFDTQWQNFKSIGIQSTYSIVNAYGPHTLAQSMRNSQAK